MRTEEHPLGMASHGRGGVPTASMLPGGPAGLPRTSGSSASAVLLFCPQYLAHSREPRSREQASLTPVLLA